LGKLLTATAKVNTGAPVDREFSSGNVVVGVVVGTVASITPVMVGRWLPEL